ncbi:UNVERIFIED_CONTAM: hypothetical protein Slati_3790700 [Sesamum latifolium]|uniref:Uncharacterized protein n=1 Tax=Sesamum latifolium TaxID=2727402 RepID=A0AAW2U536_9LAMI
MFYVRGMFFPFNHCNLYAHAFTFYYLVGVFPFQVQLSNRAGSFTLASYALAILALYIATRTAALSLASSTKSRFIPQSLHIGLCVVIFHSSRKLSYLRRRHSFHPITKVKWGFSRGGSWCCSICPQYTRELVHPCPLGGSQPRLQMLEDRSVGDFHLTVRLQVAHRGEELFDP